MGDVIVLDTPTLLDLPIDRVLESAKGVVTGEVVVLGWADEDQLYFASSIADKSAVLYLLEIAKKQLLEMDDE